MQIRIEEILPCSCGYQDCPESTVRFVIGGKLYSAFATDVDVPVGSQVEVEFDADAGETEWEEVFNGNKEKSKALTQTGDWSYDGFGEIISINPVIADFGGVQLDLGELTHDDRVIGEFIFQKIEVLKIYLPRS